MELKVGDYVRTRHYGIFKILNIEKVNKIIFFKKAQGIDVVIADKNNPIEEEIIKSSPNIIDLIQVGDVIRFKELRTKITNGLNYYEIYIFDIHNSKELEVIKNEIKNKNIELLSIVTKEQFENMEYRIGGNK